MAGNEDSVGVTPQHDPEAEGLAWECENCLSATTEDGECTVCGAEPFEGDGYRIECLDCGAVEFGDRGDNVQYDMRHHRMEYCSGAEFEVTAQ